MIRKFIDGRKAGTGRQPTYIAKLVSAEQRENVFVPDGHLGQAKKKHILQSWGQPDHEKFVDGQQPAYIAKPGSAR